MTKTNIVLIGMPGVGKSTFGVVLAKLAAKAFIDTDLLLQEAYGESLQQQLDQYGYQTLREREQDVLLDLEVSNCVIATGGSAVYGATAMGYLAENAVIVYLRASITTLQQRINNMSSRGIAKTPLQSFDEVYAERTPLYEQYANIVVNTDAPASLDQEAEALLKQVEAYLTR